MKNKLIRLILAGVIILFLACGIYLNDYYHADMDAIEAFAVEHSVEMRSDAEGNLVFEPEKATAGFIFYPGGKVAAEAYAPLARQLAEKGMFCVVAKMTVNLAFLDVDAANGVLEAYPQVDTWYVGGHSLGGVAACQWAQGHADSVSGIILLASYPSVDLSATGLRMLSIYGTNDQVINRDNYVESHTLRPGDFKEVVIDGGNHAQFGEYGAQEGDGDPAISAQEQRDQAVDAILEWTDVTKAPE
jgi:pimeloyl-ACP methyl ester carboxylesterase